MQQLYYFCLDVKRMLGANPLGIVLFVFTKQFWGIFLYRIDRCLFLLFGRLYRVVRLFFYPILKPLEFFSSVEISYKSEIGPGIKLLHGSNGLVVSEYAKIGKNVTFVTGTVIGIKDITRKYPKYSIKIGDNCIIGANSVILGPVQIGDNCVVGAQALVVKDAPANCDIIGVPAINKMR